MSYHFTSPFDPFSLVPCKQPPPAPSEGLLLIPFPAETVSDEASTRTRKAIPRIQHSCLLI